MTTTREADPRAEQQRTYGNWRLGRRAGLFGLGPVGTGAAFVVMVLAAGLMAVSFLAAIVALLAGAAVLTPLAVRVNNRTGLQVLSARLAWTWGRARRRHVTSPVSPPK